MHVDFIFCPIYALVLKNVGFCIFLPESSYRQCQLSDASSISPLTTCVRQNKIFLIRSLKTSRNHARPKIVDNYRYSYVRQNYSLGFRQVYKHIYSLEIFQDRVKCCKIITDSPQTQLAGIDLEVCPLPYILGYVNDNLGKSLLKPKIETKLPWK